MRKKSNIFYLSIVAIFFGISASRAQAPYPGKELPGPASLLEKKDQVILQNRLISLTVFMGNEKVKAIGVVNKIDGTSFEFSAENLFRFVKSEGEAIALSDLYLKGAPAKVVTEDKKQIRLFLTHPTLDLSLSWNLVLEDDKNFIRQFLEIKSRHVIEEIRALPIASGLKPEIVGSVDGSPVIAGNMFWAIENPLFKVDKGPRTTLSINPYDWKKTLDGPHVYNETVAIGTYPDGHIRRAFVFLLYKIIVRHEPSMYFVEI